MECLLPFLAMAIIFGGFIGIITTFDVLFTERWEDYLIYDFWKKWLK